LYRFKGPILPYKKTTTHDYFVNRLQNRRCRFMEEVIELKLHVQIDRVELFMPG